MYFFRKQIRNLDSILSNYLCNLLRKWPLKFLETHLSIAIGLSLLLSSGFWISSFQQFCECALFKTVDKIRSCDRCKEIATFFHYFCRNMAYLWWRFSIDINFLFKFYPISLNFLRLDWIPPILLRYILIALHKEGFRYLDIANYLV